MTNKLKLFVIAATILFAACQNEKDIKIENQNSINADFIVKDGRIVFKDINSYINTYKILKQYNSEQLKDWSIKTGIIPLQYSYNEKENDSINYEDSYLSQLQGPLAYIYNQDGVLQYSDTILVVKNEKIISINDGNELTLKSILAGEDIKEMSGIVAANHSTLLTIKGNDNLNGPMKVWENSHMFYASNRLRYFAEFKAISKKITPDIYKVTEFYITGMRQLRFLGVWWAPTQHPIQNSSIKFNGTINGEGVYYGGPGIRYNANQIFTGVGPYLAYPSLPSFNVSVTYTFSLTEVPLSGERIIRYTAEP